MELRAWQKKALAAWSDAGGRGIVSVVTGGGKTVFALACIASRPDLTPVIVVPSVVLLDQWWEEAAAFFGLTLDEVHVFDGNEGKLAPGTVNIAVVNTASRLAKPLGGRPVLLVADECHKMASEQFRAALDWGAKATLGLSATPERQYDNLLDEVLVPALGPVIFRYTYADAVADRVIVPFDLVNVCFELESALQEKFDKLTKAIGASASTYGMEAERTVALLLRRARLLNSSPSRIKLAVKIALAHREKKVIVFHEDIAACEAIAELLRRAEVRAEAYHSGMSRRRRVDLVSRFRASSGFTLVTCRALDEGFNVPESEVGIVAASTATRRQRIQRLGRLLRPAQGKATATVYTLAASKAELQRLRDEEAELEGVADVTWTRA